MRLLGAPFNADWKNWHCAGAYKKVRPSRLNTAACSKGWHANAACRIKRGLVQKDCGVLIGYYGEKNSCRADWFRCFFLLRGIFFKAAEQNWHIAIYADTLLQKWSLLHNRHKFFGRLNSHYHADNYWNNFSRYNSNAWAEQFIDGYTSLNGIRLYACYYKCCPFNIDIAACDEYWFGSRIITFRQNFFVNFNLVNLLTD